MQCPKDGGPSTPSDPQRCLLPPPGSSQTALSASRARSTLMRCDRSQPSAPLCHIKGICVLHHSTPVLWCPVLVPEPIPAINDSVNVRNHHLIKPLKTKKSSLRSSADCVRKGIPSPPCTANCVLSYCGVKWCSGKVIKTRAHSKNEREC